MHRYRSHTCGALRDTHIGEEVRLSGWVHRMRDHGGVLFIDLRDHYGITQVVADPDSPAFKDAEKLHAEWVIRIDGKVRRRPGGTENPDLPTGAVEVYISAIEVLGPGGRAADAGVRRPGVPGGDPPRSTASSTCGANGCTATSSSAGRSSTRSAGA
jgi:aspartyl/asparaginyl-tRNA synthetase